MLTIRKAGKEDAAVISLLGWVTFSQAFGHLFPKSEIEEYLLRTFRFEKIRDSLLKENNAYWLALFDGIPVGYAKIKFQSPNVAILDEAPVQLQKIYVLEHFHDRKIGLALLDAVFDFLSFTTAKTLWLLVWEGNKRALRFYELSGFVKSDIQYFQIGSQRFTFHLLFKNL